MQQMAMSWLVYRLTNSAVLLGVAGFAGQIPSLIFSPFAGIVADRYNKFRILMLCNILFMIQALLLATLIFTKNISINGILFMAFFQGVIIAFEAPARHAFLPLMIDERSDLKNAISLNSASFHGSRLIGPSLGGIIVAFWGEESCFFINGVSYTAVIAAMFFMKIKFTPSVIEDKKILSYLREGIYYSYRNESIKNMLLLITCISLFAMPYVIMMPIIAKDVLHGDAKTLGWLMGGAGFGAFSGALYLASLRESKTFVNIISIAPAIFSAGIIATAFSENFFITTVFLMFCSFGIMSSMSSSNTILMSIVEDSKRGRVMSLYTLAFIGIIPFGNLFAGFIASHAGPKNTLIMLGSLSFLSTLYFFRKIQRIKNTNLL